MKRFATFVLLVACGGCEFGFQWGVDGHDNTGPTQPAQPASSTPSDPATSSNDGPIGTWRAIPSWGEARNDTEALWMGQRLILFGGDGAPAALDPDSGSLQPLHDANALVGTDPMAAAVDDRDIVSWRLGSGGRYDTIAEMSLPISSLDSAGARYGASTVWTGHDLMVWGGGDASGLVEGGALYDPAADRWSQVRAEGAPSPRAYHTATVMDDSVLVFGGESAGHVPLGDGAVFRSAYDTWLQLPVENEPSARTHHSTVWTGHEAIVWGGSGANGAPLGDGAAFDPDTWTWHAISTQNAPSPRAQHVAVWTDHGMVVWGGVDSQGHALGGGAVYDPAADRWTPLATALAPSPRADALAAWTGREVVIVGGHDGTVACDDGAVLSF